MSSALASPPIATSTWRDTWPMQRRDALVLVGWFALLTAVWTGVGLLLTGPLADSWLVRTDEDASRWLADHRTPWLDDVTWIGSMLADTIVKIAVTAVVALVMLLVWRSWREPVVVVMALVLEASTFVVVTAIVGRPRPDVVRLEGSPIDSSFPSGHTAAAAAYGAIVVVLWWRTDRRSVRTISVAVLVAVVLAVGASRAVSRHAPRHRRAGRCRARCRRGGRRRRTGGPTITRSGPPPLQRRGASSERNNRRGHVSVTLVVALVAVAAAVVAFALSASREVAADPIDPARPERAVASWLAHRPRLARFMRERFDRRTRGGFLVTIAFVVVGVVALLVGLLLDMIDRSSRLASVDERVARWGSEHASSGAIHVLDVVTDLGGTPVVIAALAAVAVGDFVRRRNAEVFAFVAVVGVGQLVLCNLLKVIVDRDRPAVLQLVDVTGPSFPSGHSTAAAATWSAVALVLSRGRVRRVRAVLAAAAVLVAAAVAASRALLGVHWVSDVIAGLAIGWGWFLLVAIAFGGRAQRLGDPTSAVPEGTRPDPPVLDDGIQRAGPVSAPPRREVRTGGSS